jgi:type II secretory pathway pseudopilin PulG
MTMLAVILLGVLTFALIIEVVGAAADARRAQALREIERVRRGY